MKARRAAMIVAMAAVVGVSEASLAQPAGETAAKECAACVRLEPIGTSFTTGEGSGTYKTIYSVVVGVPETGERLAGIWTPKYGMYGLDAVLWVREIPDDVTRWRKISLRRPKSPADIVLFASRPEAFRDEVRGGASILPGPFSGLHPVELATLDHVVSYAAGGTRALLKVGITERDAAALIGSVQVGADASFEATPCTALVARRCARQE